MGGRGGWGEVVTESGMFMSDGGVGVPCIGNVSNVVEMTSKDGLLTLNDRAATKDEKLICIMQ